LIDFEAIDHFLRVTYPYVDTSNYKVVGLGKPYYIGEDKNNCIKENRNNKFAFSAWGFFQQTRRKKGA